LGNGVTKKIKKTSLTGRLRAINREAISRAKASHGRTAAARLQSQTEKRKIKLKGTRSNRSRNYTLANLLDHNILGRQ